MSIRIDIKRTLAKGLKRIRRSLKKTFSKKRNQRRGIYAVSALVSISLLTALQHVSLSAARSREEAYNKQLHLEDLTEQLENLHKEKTHTESELQRQKAEERELDEKIERLQSELQAKKERESLIARAAQRVAPVAHAEPAPRPSGSCQDWMRQAGITDMANAYTLIMRESGCNPNAVNASSGACGIGQQLPCGKWPHRWNDPVGGMIDMQGYVMARYKSWAAAVAFHNANNYY